MTIIMQYSLRQTIGKMGSGSNLLNSLSSVNLDPHECWAQVSLLWRKVLADHIKKVKHRGPGFCTVHHLDDGVELMNLHPLLFKMKVWGSIRKDTIHLAQS